MTAPLDWHRDRWRVPAFGYEVRDHLANSKAVPRALCGLLSVACRVWLSALGVAGGMADARVVRLILVAKRAAGDASAHGTGGRSDRSW